MQRVDFEMPHNYVTNVSDIEIKMAYQTMQDKTLVFFPNYTQSLKSLISFVQEKNADLYQKKEFTFLDSIYDSNLIVAAVPELGLKQLGVFAAKDFERGEVIAVYQGQDISGKLSADQMQRNILECEKTGDYHWEIKSMQIDSTFVGSIARFVNDSLQTNAELLVHENKIFYRAKNKISFGQEITISYGDNYFNRAHPRIEYVPKTLSEILNKLFVMNCGEEELTATPLNNLTELRNFLEILGWNLTSLLGSLSPKIEKKFKIPEQRGNEGKDLFLDEENNPLIFDLFGKGNNCLIEKTVAAKFSKTSSYKLFAAPTRKHEQYRRFSLFAGQKIRKKACVCEIKGENLTKKEVLKKTLDPDFLFEINNNINVYCKNYASEALFVQGVSWHTEANVKLTLDRNVPKYIALKDILPGDEIVAFYGTEYPFVKIASHLESLMTDFNSQQLAWDGFLSYNSTTEQYNIEFFKHFEKENVAINSSMVEDNLPEIAVAKNIVMLPQYNATPMEIPIWEPKWFFPQYKSLPVRILPVKESFVDPRPIHKKARTILNGF